MIVKLDVICVEMFNLTRGMMSCLTFITILVVGFSLVVDASSEDGDLGLLLKRLMREDNRSHLDVLASDSNHLWQLASALHEGNKHDDEYTISLSLFNITKLRGKQLSELPLPCPVLSGSVDR